MIKYYIHGIIMFCLTTSMVHADCTFQVVNDSLTPINVEAGYYNADKTKVTFKVMPATAVERLVKNDFKCNEINKSGLGITYVNLVGGASVGGWVFDPNISQIRAVGASATQTGAIGRAPGGVSIYLAGTRNPEVDRFIVMIKSVQSSSRQNASMN